MILIPNLSRNLAVINTSLQRGASAFRTSIPLFPVFSVISCLILSLLLTGCSKSSSDSASSPSGSASKKLTIALMPKSKGNAYFISCKQGADEAAKELGVELLFDGPTDPDPAKQNEIIENWITLGVDAIAAAGFDRALVVRVAQLIRINEYKRRQAPVGIRVTHRSFGKDWRYPITSKFRQ